jgi:hypothetical protein
VDLTVAAPARVRRDRVVVFIQRLARHTAVVTRKGSHINLRVRLARGELTVKVVGHRGVPHASASVRPVRVEAPRHSGGTTGGTTSAQPIAYGAYVSGVPEWPSLLDKFSSQVGRTPSLVLWYRYWGENLFNPTELQALASRGAAPMVTWEPWNPDHSDVSLKGIAAGTSTARSAPTPRPPSRGASRSWSGSRRR